MALWEEKPGPPVKEDRKDFDRNGFAVLDLQRRDIEVRPGAG